MNRRSFLALLGLTGCLDKNEDCMTINKKWWLMAGGGGVSDPSINIDNQQVWAIIGDSKAAGTSNAVGDTPSSNTVYQWDRTTGGGSIVTVGASDILYVANTGSQWPNFGINYYNNTGIKPIFVNNGLSNARFYASENAALSWRVSDGDLYPAAKTRIDACMTAANVTALGGVLMVLGVNDIRTSTDSVADVNAACTALIDQINTDYDSPPIYISIPGHGITPSERVGEIKWHIKGLADTYSNVHVTIHELTLYTNNLFFDTLHFSYDGNKKYAEMLANYIADSESDKEIRRVKNCCFVNALSSGHKTAYSTFITSSKASGNWEKLECLQIYRAASRENILTDIISLAAARDFSFGFNANDSITTDGITQYLDSYFNPFAYKLNSDVNDFIAGIATGTMGAMSGVLATAFGTTSGSRTMLSKDASNDIKWHASRNTSSIYATDNQIESDKAYALKRTTSTNAILLKDNSTLQTETGAASAAQANGPLMVGCRGTGFTPSEYHEGEFYYLFHADSSLNYTDFLTHINTLLTALS